MQTLPDLKTFNGEEKDQRIVPLLKQNEMLLAQCAHSAVLEKEIEALKEQTGQEQPKQP